MEDQINRLRCVRRGRGRRPCVYVDKDAAGMPHMILDMPAVFSNGGKQAHGLRYRKGTAGCSRMAQGGMQRNGLGCAGSWTALYVCGFTCWHDFAFACVGNRLV